MRDLNENSSSTSWDLYYGDKSTTNRQYLAGFYPTMTSVDGYPGYENALKQKMLEHEAIFKNQVFELHRLYRIQRDMMDEVKRDESHRFMESNNPSSSSSLPGSQLQSSGDKSKRPKEGFPFFSSDPGRKSFPMVEMDSSPMSCTKGKNVEPEQFQFHNKYSLKECEALDGRPLKVRRKLFDLQLPADEYIDIEAEKQLEFGTEGGTELSRGRCAGVINPIGLANPNGPAENEEETTPSFDFLGHISSNERKKGINQAAKWYSFHGGESENTMHMHDGFLNLPGSSRSNINPQTNNHQLDKLLLLPPHLVEAQPRPVEHPFVSPQSSGSHPFLSSCFGGSWIPPSGAVLEKSMCSFTEKIRSSLDSANSASLQTSAPYLGYSRGMLQAITSSNSVYHGSTSGSRKLKDHLPSAGFGYLNYSSGDKLQSSSSKILGFGNFTNKHSMPELAVDLNEVVPKGLPATVRSLNTIDGESKPEDHLSTLPWLKCKPVKAKEVSSQLCNKKEAVGDLNQRGMLALSDCEISRKNKIFKAQNVKKIFGVPIFVRCDPGENASWHAPTLQSKNESREIDMNRECEMDEELLFVEKRVPKKSATLKGCIDLNSCFTNNEDYYKPAHAKTAAVEIDLEAPVTMENEDSTPCEQASVSKAPSQLLETETEKRQDAVLLNAAEILVAISASPVHIHTEDSLLHPQGEDLLIWFANAMTSCANELEEVDDFEFTTLELQEMKEEDYMPIPFFPKIKQMGTTSLPNRPRRGPSRRGRQRRDFQRHILPGLATLSRHDVTEDLQTFGGIMRATGHDWISGLTRRNGSGSSSARGRKPAVVIGTVSNITLTEQLNKIEVVFEDRSLRGWGKKTRRPRRQRCPPTGNPATAVFM